MCNPSSSSLLANQLNIINNNNYYKELITFDSATQSTIITFIERATNLNSIYMLGGEPFLNEFHDEIIRMLIDTGRSKNINLYYHSNLQANIEKHLHNCLQFKSANISVSVDGSDETYEFIR
jgi:organic radical activating enzyme